MDNNVSCLVSRPPLWCRLKYSYLMDFGYSNTMRLTFKTITIGWIAVKFGKHIHRPQTRKCNLFDPLTAFAYD